ncbi:hypothetical protein SASPL_119667 [Salvia splendens]|uniref:BHLH domain-containing protein n=1 Tax=Salvia splendens TaxID=180675 RepID=A0A8X8XNR1_SALSN|nr:hypothetical protein SASPL_119667 [Salvia splendens]
MAGNSGFGDDPLAPGCYSQLLFSDEISGLDSDGCFGFDDNIGNPKMLCFGDYGNANKMEQKPGFTCMDPRRETGRALGVRGDAAEPRLVMVVKKEKLGERITALQQLVSPFGKTDTASVLHEALGYIRFLHDQVQVLCSPYLQHMSPSSSDAPHSSLSVGDEINSKSSKDDLRSRGLCLVPVDLTLHVANSNGADLWSSARMVNTVSSN